MEHAYKGGHMMYKWYEQLFKNNIFGEFKRRYKKTLSQFLTQGHFLYIVCEPTPMLKHIIICA
jgi:hypothetical protein